MINHDINRSELIYYLSNIVKYDRLSGSQGELNALQFIQDELNKYNISNTLYKYPSYLSNPFYGKLYILEGSRKTEIKAKTRSFSKNTSGKEIKGELIYIDEESLIDSIIEYNLKKTDFKNDLENKIVISESLNPISVLEVQNRGAIGFIQYWNGNEDEIHEGIYNPIWGAPGYEDIDFYPGIPIIAINGKDGKKIVEKLSYDRIEVSMCTDLEEGIQLIPILEANIEPKNNNDGKFILIGNHIDSWHYGATDNGTGNALALYLAKYYKNIIRKFNIGVKIAWWSGHSNGRYAGSSAYAADKFEELMEGCIAYVNIDMPGLRGANDYTNISSGPGLIELSKQKIFEVTNQIGYYSGMVRGWDQSFQNIGITPYFIWASTLERNHPETTNDSFMSWWWHTEKDLLTYFDINVLEKDTRLYITAINDLLLYGINAFEIKELFKLIYNTLNEYNQKYAHIINLNTLINKVEETWELFSRVEDDLEQDKKLSLIRLLNRIYYVSREAHLQDYALQEKPIPRLNEVFRIYESSKNKKYRFILDNQLISERNRILNVLIEINKLLKSSIKEKL